MYLPTIRQLQYLLALKKHGSFSRAAQASLVTQSTLSAGIKELEALLGVTVVERTKRKVIFTPFGEEIVAQAGAVVSAAEELVHLAQSRTAPLTGPLRLGVIPTIGPFLLPRVMRPLKRSYPKLQLFLTEDSTEHLIGLLNAGRLDAALIALPYDLPQLNMEKICEDPLLFATSNPQLSVQAAHEPIKNLEGDNLLLLEEGHCLRDHVLEACRPAKDLSASEFGATSLLTLVQMVGAGLGSTMIPQSAVEAGILKGTSVKAIPLHPPPIREIVLVWRLSSTRTGDFKKLADILREHAPS